MIANYTLYNAIFINKYFSVCLDFLPLRPKYHYSQLYFSFSRFHDNCEKLVFFSAIFSY